MGNETGKSNVVVSGQLAGMLWFAGWLFTWAFANLGFWKVVLGIIIWPFYLGDAVQ
jgi:hypothetical protein